MAFESGAAREMGFGCVAIRRRLSNDSNLTIELWESDGVGDFLLDVAGSHLGSLGAGLSALGQR